MLPSRILKALLPLLIFALIAIFLVKGLHRNPHVVPSTLINRPVPSLPGVDPSTFKGRVTLLNVFASWCLYCRSEHPMLMDISNNKSLQLVGLDYKDRPEKVRQFLKQYGNPYEKIIEDPYGKIAINLGVYGTPETFVIDKKGIIRYKHVGPISPDVWHEKLQTLVKRLNGEK